MRQTIVRWTAFTLALCVLGPIAGMLTALLRAFDGGPDASLLVTSSPVQGILAGLTAILLAGLSGILGARLTTPRDGLTIAGLVLVWAAARTGRVDVILRQAGDDSILWRLALEGAIVGGAGVLLAAAIYAVGRPAEQLAQPSADARGSFLRAGFGALRRALAGEGVLKALPPAILAGGAIGWIVAASPLKGQAIAAAFTAGLASAWAARLIDQRTPAQTIFVAVAVLAILGPPTAFYFGSGDGPVVDAYTQDLAPLAGVMPLDWLSGALLGVPWGLSWAGSAGERYAKSARSVPAASR